MSILKVVRHSIKRGVVTILYPRVPIEVDEFYRGLPKLDPRLCIGCGACANACPPEAIRVEDRDGRKVWRIFYGRCIFCARCQEVCPVGAIELSKEFEAASRSREDLVFEAIFEGAKCRACGRYTGVTRREVELAKEILSLSETPRELVEKLSEYASMCSDCKRKLLREKLAGVWRGGGS